MQKLLMRVRDAHRVHGARMYTWLTCVLCTVLIAAMALTATGCQTAGGDQETGAQTSVESATVAITDSTTEAETIPALGQGATTFTLAITFGDKTGKQYLIHTDKQTVGDALLELGLIAGEESEYGLYVKTVDGVTADYDVDGTYWAFYIDGAYAVTGVSGTDITPGATYALKVEK